MQNEPNSEDPEPVARLAVLGPGLAKTSLPQPPLSISHLMHWMLGSAIILGVMRTIPQPEAAEKWLQVARVVEQVLLSGLYGIKLAAMLIFLSRFVSRRAPLPREPGHWLLFCGGILLVVTWVSFLLLFGIGGDGANDVLKSVSLLLIIVYYASAILLLLAIFGLAGRRALGWQILFSYQLLYSAISVLLPIILLVEVLMETAGQSFTIGLFAFATFNELQPWTEYAPVLAAIALLLGWDAARGRKRDWLHHIGAWTELVTLTVYIVMRVIPAIAK